MIGSKEKVHLSYKSKEAISQWRVYTWDNARSIYVSSAMTFGYFEACRIVREHNA